MSSAPPTIRLWKPSSRWAADFEAGVEYTVSRERGNYEPVIRSPVIESFPFAITSPAYGEPSKRAVPVAMPRLLGDSAPTDNGARAQLAFSSSRFLRE